METRHVKIDYEEALSGKKQILSSQLNLLHMVKKLKAYKVLRKKEFATKTNLKTQLISLKNKLNLIESTFPQEEPSKTIKKREKRIQQKETQDLQSELEDIQSKLSKLGK